MQAGHGRVMVVRILLVLLPFLVAAAAFGISQTGRVLQDKPFTWKQFPFNFDVSVSPFAKYAALFTAVVLSGIFLRPGLHRPRLRAFLIALWATAFAITFLLVWAGVGSALEWLQHSVGIRNVDKHVPFAAAIAIFGALTCALLYWTFRSRAIAVCCAIATAAAAGLFYVLDDESAETWAPLVWNTVTCAGLSIALWPRLPLFNNCPKCGYDLTGLSSDRCPECGTKIAVSATPTSGRLP